MPAFFVFSAVFFGECGQTAQFRVGIQERSVEAVSGSGALPIVVICLLALIFVSMYFSSRRKRPGPMKSHLTSSTGIPDGMEADYRCGVDPCRCGMPVMYTLHTCRHCVRLKDFLDEHGIEHKLIYVDDFEDPARKQIMTTLRSHNPRGSFPTLVVPDGRSVVGFREEAVRALLGLKD